MHSNIARCIDNGYRLTRADIDEILHYGHIIPVSKGITQRFIARRYPQHNWNDLMAVFRAANVVDRSG